MVYNKAVADVIVFNNTDVVRTSNYNGVEYSSESNFYDLITQMAGWKLDDINDALKHITHCNSAANAWRNLLFGDNVGEVQNTADYWHRACAQYTILSGAENYSSEVESDIFDKEWDDSETDW